MQSIAAPVGREAPGNGLLRAIMAVLRFAWGKGLEYLVALLVLADVIDVAAGVVTRYLLNNSLPWTDEIGRLFLIWMIFLGGIIALKRGEHFAMSSAVDRMPAGFRKHVLNVRDLMVLGLFAALALASTNLALLRLNVPSTATGMSSSLFIWPMAIATVVMFGYQLYHLIRRPMRDLLLALAVLLVVGISISTVVMQFGPGLVKSNSGVVMVSGFILLMILNVPISFSMGIVSVTYILAVGDIPQRIIPQRIEGGMESFILVAIPLFILAGQFMELGGMSRRFVNFAMVLVGHIRGGLAMVTVVAEILFSGISGSSAADVSAVGAVVIPSLKKTGYKAEEAVAVVSAASAMGILVPPAIIMVILAAITQQSVITLFFAGFVPALVLASALMILIYVKARRGNWPSQPRPSWGEGLHATVDAIIPGFTAVIIFGGILLGIVTVTEAAVAAAIYSMIVAVVIYREVRLREVPSIFEKCGSTTGMVNWKLGTATLFAWILTIQRVPDAILNFMTTLGGGYVPFLIFTILVFIILSGLMDNVPVTLIFAPILFPVALKLGVNPIHFNILMVAAGGIGIFLAPIGICFVLACAVGGTSVDKTTRPFLPYLIALLIGLLLVAFVPWFTLIVPQLLEMR